MQSIEEGVGITKRQELSKLGGEEKSYGNFSDGVSGVRVPP